LSKLSQHPLWIWLQQLRGVRIVNLVFGILFAVHVFACGWYLCAVFHEDPQETWLARRSLDTDGELTLLDNSDPGLQWLHSMYFVLTVFTTVGFGDMSAVTSGEIVYVSITFLMGAVVHSILVGEVINVVSAVDERGRFVFEQQKLVRSFASHTELGEEEAETLSDWVATKAEMWMTYRYDKDAMKELVTGKYFDRALMESMPRKLFSGDFLKSKFFQCLPDGFSQLPPRMMILFALASYRYQVEAQEIVYGNGDVAMNMFGGEWLFCTHWLAFCIWGQGRSPSCS